MLPHSFSKNEFLNTESRLIFKSKSVLLWGQKLLQKLEEKYLELYMKYVSNLDLTSKFSIRN
jgi:hypothetical protein